MSEKKIGVLASGDLAQEPSICHDLARFARKNLLLFEESTDDHVLSFAIYA